MDLASLPLTWQLSAALLLGLVVGSFLNVVILRLPRRMQAEFAAACAELEGREPREPPPATRWFGLDYLIHPPSHCPACGHRIRAWENIPILSWLLLRARCSQCGVTISLRYPLVELVSGLLSLAVVWRFGLTWDTLALLVLVWGLLALAMIDIDEQLLPDQITLPLLWLGLLVNLHDGFTTLQEAVMGAAAGYLSLWLVFQLFRLFTGKEGMGYGDFKLLALFGAWLGWQMLPQIILVSSLVGALMGSLLIALRRHEGGKPIPFGPYLILGGLIALFWGDAINRAYLQFAGLS
ncbi:MAG: prepilin peptidase [Gammaproteobacteria bacterium]|nr:MAG: prepilin peptidase [Gammaproteobacteria bacterium]